MAAAHGERHEYREASALVERGLRAGPGVTWAYRMLASFYAQAGEVEKATAALAEFKRHNPGITIEKLRQGMPPSMLISQPHYLDGMRKAGAEGVAQQRSEAHTSELQSLMRISYAVF